MHALGKETAFCVFENREDASYIQTVSDLLSLDSPRGAIFGGLLESAQDAEEHLAKRMSRSSPDCEIEKVINIDLMGMTGTVLLDKSRRYSPSSHYGRFQELIQKMGEINQKHKTAVRVRMLFQYPYSMAGQNRILAEGWKKRSMIGDEESSLRDETALAPHLNEADIQRSQLLTVQRYCIQNFQTLAGDLASELDGTGANRITMRFACVSMLHCGLRINSRYFCDPYHYGRERGRDSCAFGLTPIAMLTRNSTESGKAYSAFCNHFRYLWECDSTLDYMDVIDQEPEIGPVSVRRPGKIRHINKTNRLRGKKSDEGKRRDSDYWESYSKNLSRIVDRICPIVGRVDFPEVGFLAAAWEERDGAAGLCEPAGLLDDYFRHDFGGRDDVRVTVLRGEMGQLLSQELFQSLEASTFGIIILTKDIEDRFCKPNVYIELGYLLRHNGPDRTFVIAETGVEIGSDLSNLFYTPFDRDPARLRVEMTRIYCAIIRAMNRSGVISPATRDRIVANRNR